MTAPRVVFDTNVLVSALLFPAGRLSWLREAWQYWCPRATGVG